LLELYVDADACPVKDEVYRVARRHDLLVYVVTNAWMFTPPAGRVELVLVGQGFDAADDWIAERASQGDIVVTSDIPLAARCLANGARVLDAKGRAFTEDAIGSALASRELLSGLRDMGIVTGGPAPFQAQDRSRFLGRLDEMIQAIRRRS
jgi:uncharacterized protein YaiI (UPF0178 family)